MEERAASGGRQVPPRLRNIIIIIIRMLVENEAAFISALKSDLNKPVQETIMAELDFLRNDVIGLLRHIDEWTQDQ